MSKIWVTHSSIFVFGKIYLKHVQAPILIVYGATDLEIPGHNSHLLFHRAVQGSQEQETLVSEWLENSPKRVIPNEAIVYQHDNVRLVQLEYAGHNDGKGENVADTDGALNERSS